MENKGKIKRDSIINKNVKNLIRIWDSNFQKNNKNLDFLIWKNTPRYKTNRIGGIL